jgi:hypothetical protein
MTTLYDLPEGSGRRFLFGLFGHDHDEPNCEKDGCGDCSIIAGYDRDMQAKEDENDKLKKEIAQTLTALDDVHNPYRCLDPACLACPIIREAEKRVEGP